MEGAVIFTEAEQNEIVDLYCIAKVALSGDRPTNGDRARWAAGKFSERHPEHKSLKVYKWLCRQQETLR